MTNSKLTHRKPSNIVPHHQDTVARIKIETIDPNKEISRAVREFTPWATNCAVPAGHGTGETRNGLFSCKDKGHFNVVAQTLKNELIAAGIFANETEFQIDITVSADHPVQGKIIPTLPQECGEPAMRKELEDRIKKAYAYGSQPYRAPEL